MRSKSVAILLLVALTPMLGGTFSMAKSAKGPAFSPVLVPEGKAVVYFFRPNKVMLSLQTIFMSIPHQADNCYALDRAGYFAYVSEPGKLDVSSASIGFQAKDVVQHFSIDLAAGDVRYVKVEFKGGFGPPKVIYAEVPVEEALEEIKEYRAISPCD